MKSLSKNEIHLNPITNWVVHRMQRQLASESCNQEGPVTIWDTIVTPPVYLVDTVAVPEVGDSSVIDNDTVRVVITKYQDKLIVKTQVKEIEVPVSVQAECPPQIVQPQTFNDKVKDFLLLFLAASLAVMMFLYRFK